jgi:hypothetical protein
VPSFADLRAVPWAPSVLGWGLFLGIAAVAASRVFKGTRRARLGLLLATSGVSMLVLLTGFVMSTTAVALTGGLAVWFVTLPAAGVVLAAIFAIPT